MPELVIKYKNKKTLEVLKDFAKYFEFSIEVPKKSKKSNLTEINGVRILQSDSTIDTSELENVFTGKNIDSKKLRNESWQRNK